MEVLVVGGRGFIGRHVCVWLATHGHRARVVGRDDALSDGDAVVHLALYDERSACRAAAAIGDRPYVVASSGDVYLVFDQLRGREPWDGTQPGPISEEAPLRSLLYPYGREVVTPKGTFIDYDKILVERVVVAAGGIVLRLPKVYGPGDTTSMLAAAVRRWRAGEPVVIGARVVAWRWTHGYVEDIAHAIGLAITSPAPRGRVYNVGEDVTPTALDRLRAAVGDVMIVPDDRVPADLAVAAVHPVDLVLDSSRIRRELGYCEQIDHAAAIARTIASGSPSAK